MKMWCALDVWEGVMKIENKEMLLHSAQKAVSAVCRIGGEDVDEKEAYFVVGTAVH